jgi:preprotein translocase subunit YajC
MSTPTACFWMHSIIVTFYRGGPSKPPPYNRDPSRSPCVAAGFPLEDFVVLISEAFAQTAPAPIASGMDAAFGGLGGMLPLILVTVVMYFLMIRPQLKRQKDAKALVEALTVSDEVVTTGGLVGKITKVDTTYLHIEVSSGVVLQVQRQAVVQVLPKGTLSK